MYSALVVQEVLQRRQEPWRWRVQWPAIRSWQRPTERIIKADPLTTTWEVAEELSVNHSMVIQHLRQIGKVKKLDEWVPHELTSNQKYFEVSSSLILCNNNEPFIDWVMTCDKKWIWHDNWQWPVQWLDWGEAPKRFPKPSLHQKKVMPTVWRSAACPIHYSFLNPSKVITSEKHTQQIDETYGKLQCLQPAWYRKGPILHHNAPPHIAQPMLQKLNESGYDALVSSPIITWTLANWLPLLQASRWLFAGKTLPQPAGCRKCFPRVCQILKHRFLC